MDHIPFISSAQIDFIPVMPSRPIHHTTNCPICKVPLGIIGIVRSARKVCQFCTQVICKKCGERKITAQKMRICKTCYSEGLKIYFLKNITRRLNSDIEKEDRAIAEKENIRQKTENRYEAARLELENLRETHLKDKALLKKQLIPLLDVLKLEKEKFNKLKIKLSPFESELSKLKLTTSELNEEITKINVINEEKELKLKELRQELSQLQDDGTELLSVLQNRIGKCGASETIHEVETIGSVAQLKALASKKLKENSDLVSETNNLENQIQKISMELIGYEGRVSCRQPGSFSKMNVEKYRELMESKEESAKDVGKEMDKRVKELKIKYEQKRMRMSVMKDDIKSHRSGKECVCF
jgi:DNA repair exonuclease SbcCD ATPase subunit